MTWTFILGKALTYIESMVPQPHEVEVEVGRSMRRHLRTGGHIGADILAHMRWSMGAPFQIENLFFRGLAARARVVFSHNGLVERYDKESSSWPATARNITVSYWLMDSVRRLERLVGLNWITLQDRGFRLLLQSRSLFLARAGLSLPSR